MFFVSDEILQFPAKSPYHRETGVPVAGAQTRGLGGVGRPQGGGKKWGRKSVTTQENRSA